MFTPLSKEKEISLIQTSQKTGDFDPVFQYLDPLVQKIIATYLTSEEEMKQAYEDIPIPLEHLVSQYLLEEREYKFSAYFALYLKELLEKKL